MFIAEEFRSCGLDQNFVRAQTASGGVPNEYLPQVESIVDKVITSA